MLHMGGIRPDKIFMQPDSNDRPMLLLSYVTKVTDISGFIGINVAPTGNERSLTWKRQNQRVTYQTGYWFSCRIPAS